MPSHASFFFEAFSLSLSDLGTLPDIKKLFVFVLQVIAKLRHALIKLFKYVNQRLVIFKIRLTHLQDLIFKPYVAFKK